MYIGPTLYLDKLLPLITINGQGHGLGIFIPLHTIVMGYYDITILEVNYLLTLNTFNDIKFMLIFL